MPKWVWLLAGVGVVWYLMEREKRSVAISANRAATGAVDSAGKAISGVIDQAGPAIGKWLSGLFSGPAQSSSAAGSSGSGNAAKPSGSSYASIPDEVAATYGSNDGFYT